jgi:uridine monophosphate synthetase
MRLQEKIELVKHPVLKKLYQIMHKKSSNLAVSADVTDPNKLIELVEQVAEHICVLKTHMDIVENFTPQLTTKLRQLADKHNFLIFEDRKFADIGNTVLHQVRDGVYRIAQWADIINAHALPGEGIVAGLREGCKERDIGLLMLAQMSSKGNLFSEEYTKQTVAMAQANQDFVMGFIAQEKLVDDVSLVTMTPGVQMQASGDDLGQNYNNPDDIIGGKGSDIIIVGRGIYKASDPQQAAKLYQKSAWNAYLKNL